MSDITTLLVNQVREGLEKMSKNGVGIINAEDSEGIQYAIDGRYFYISVKELGEAGRER